MGRRMLLGAATLLALEAISVAWAWPHAARWADTGGLAAVARAGEGFPERTLERTRFLAVRAAEALGARALDRAGAWLAAFDLGHRAPATATWESFATVAVDAVEPATCRVAPRIAVAVERVRLRRVVAPEAMF